MQKIIWAILLSALAGLILFVQPVFAAEQNESIVTYINLNEKGLYDVEIILTKDDKILLPFKQLSEIFEVKTKINHSTKEIDFETSDGKKGRVGKDYIIFDNKKISSNHNVYLRQGLMDEVRDEIFCSEKDLSLIFDSEIKSDKNDLSIIANTNRDLVLLKGAEDDSKDEDTKKIKAYKNILAPEKNKKIQFDSISLNNNTMSDTVSQYLINGTNKNMFLNNNTQVVLKGKAYDGDLSIDMNTYNYKGELFSFGGLGFNYRKKLKNWEYELGRVRGVKDELYTIGNQMLGFQFSNYEFKPKSYRELNGQVASDSLVKVFVDEKEECLLSTYDGYYSLNDLTLEQTPKTLKLEEVKSDGTSQTIYETKYPKYKNMPEAKQKKYTFFGGVTGYNNKLFNSNGYIYEMNTKKFLLGSQYEYGIKDNLKFDSKFSFDSIYSQPKNSIWQSIYSTDALLTSGTWKNPNNLEGLSWLNTLEHIKNDNLSSKLIMGLSSANDINLGLNQMGGYTIAAETNYHKNNYYLKGGLFTTSSDFYLAGGDGSYYNDRTGGMIAGGISKNNGGINGSIKKYFSNSAYRFEGGLIDFNEYNLGFYKNIDKFADIKFHINGRSGENDIARNNSYYYDFNISKKINSKLSIEGGKTESNYSTDYSANNSNYTSYSSKYSTIYLKADYKMPKNLGTLNLGHDIINYNYSNQPNEYNMMKIGYTFPEFKRVTLSLGTGYKYTGSDNGFDIYANLAYRTKSGRIINLNYQYNQMGGYIINNMFLPMSSRHSINIVVNDAFALLPSGIKSVGYTDDNRGYVDVVAYIDRNKNGKFDRKDIKVKNVPIKVSWDNNTIYTNRHGRAYPVGTESGAYNIKVDTEKLPTTLLVDRLNEQGRKIRVEARKTTKVEIPVTSCIGNITGSLKILDDFGRTKNIDDFIVVLNNEQGEEVSYSTVDEYGKFYFSGIAPGKYKLKLDDSFINSNSLENYENKSVLDIDIPYGYKKFVDINNLELIYKSI